MPMPRDFQHACEDFDALLEAARIGADLATRNQTWTMVDAVLRVFRRRLSVAQAIGFADVLPPLVRAMFVADWRVDVAPVAFSSRAELTAEVQEVRRHHNFAPETAIGCVAAALRRQVDPIAFDRVLATLPEGARDYWAVEAPAV
jgi:uncharacterized protein (DUF2267 family)